MNLESNTVKLLSEYGEGYALLYEIGIGLGAELSQLLSLQVDDVNYCDCEETPGDRQEQPWVLNCSCI